ncbi:MAG: hypothetical protein ACK58T_41560 [Phycisphaerae bacterium]
MPLGSWHFVVQAEPLGLSRHSCGRPILELLLPDNVDAKFGVARLPQTDGTAAHLGARVSSVSAVDGCFKTRNAGALPRFGLFPKRRRVWLRSR